MQFTGRSRKEDTKSQFAYDAVWSGENVLILPVKAEEPWMVTHQCMNGCGWVNVTCFTVCKEYEVVMKSRKVLLYIQ